jgi:hypothetical protein
MIAAHRISAQRIASLSPAVRATESRQANRLRFAQMVAGVGNINRCLPKRITRQ